ncbi:MAG: hypothetical protein KDA57_20105, partial [Planctomycetales bacterium]|nr:hypothetical protein [Planctomycetales bacterium]
MARSCAAALFGLLVTVSQDGERALAVSGTVFDWPTLSNRAGNLPAYSRQSGLHVSVDSTWVGDRGYRPVRITFSAPKPVTGDVQITVRFRAGHWRSQTRSILVEQDAELLQGTSSATVTLLVPQYVDWQGCGWEVWVDGKKDEELMLSGIGFGQSNVGGHQYSALALPTWAIGAQPDQSLQRFSGDKIEALAAVDAQLPASWLGYSNLDLVVAFPEDLEQLEKNSPERFEQLLRWVRTGGNLWVFNVGREYGQLAQVNDRLGLTNEDGEDQNTPQDKLFGWRALPLRGQHNRGPDALVILDGRKKLESIPAPAVESESLDSVEYVQDSHDW